MTDPDQPDQPDQPASSPFPQLSRFRFGLRALGRIRLPPYPGSAWRGLLGHGLRRTACVTCAPACDGCLLIHGCVYSQLFETPPPPGLDLRGFSSVPHPFVLNIEPRGPQAVRAALADVLRHHFNAPRAALGRVAVRVWVGTAPGRGSVGGPLTYALQGDQTRASSRAMARAASDGRRAQGPAEIGTGKTMPDDSGKLYVYEALELRAAFDREIRLLGRLIRPEEGRRGSFLADRDSMELRAAAGFVPQDAEARLRALKVKRLKLNEAIQVANFRAEITFDGESLSLARALELRKSLLQDLEQLADRAQEAAYIRILHKEERDIETVPLHPFPEAYADFEEAQDRFRTLVTALHHANHEVTVTFRDA
jgi:hypothetical protein